MLIPVVRLHTNTTGELPIKRLLVVMSNIYITEPATEGKVLLHTSFGDLDVELWPQQAPKACRNFVQLCLEGVSASALRPSRRFCS